jgi:hypothetical protein
LLFRGNSCFFLRERNKKLSINGKTDWSFEGKNAEFKVPEGGDYTFAGTLTGTKNETFVLKKRAFL